MNTLNISENFYSVQCEGITTGIPAYFIRLANCNLFCGSSQKTLNRIRKGEKDVELVTENNATWVCDSIPVWLKGVEQPFECIVNDWVEKSIENDIINGHIHIVWTGGEPLLPKNQDAIINFEEWLSGEMFTHRMYQEIETNGTIVMKNYLRAIINQINCSPKLSNSGMSEKKRIVPEAIKAILNHGRYQFKFVISNEDDIKEMFSTFIKPFKIPLQNVVCMPGMDERNDYFSTAEFILEMAKKYRFRGMTRLHIAAWNRKTGV